MSGPNDANGPKSPNAARRSAGPRKGAGPARMIVRHRKNAGPRNDEARNAGTLLAHGGMHRVAGAAAGEVVTAARAARIAGRIAAPESRRGLTRIKDDP